MEMTGDQMETSEDSKSSNIWLHMSCSLFIPELFFKDDKKYTGITRLDLVDRKRFSLQCVICSTKKCGASVQCA